MGLYTKKPVTIEAIQYRAGEQPSELADDVISGRLIYLGDGRARIDTLEGVMFASPGDWIIWGVKGELYPCKPDIFEATYAAARPSGTSALSFGEALVALKAGERVCRAGWNGKGMWLSLSGPLEGRAIPHESFWSDNNSDYALRNGGSATVLPCITMKTATGEILMGWLASQTDMLADDWMVVAARNVAADRCPPLPLT